MLTKQKREEMKTRIAGLTWIRDKEDLLASTNTERRYEDTISDLLQDCAALLAHIEEVEAQRDTLENILNKRAEAEMEMIAEVEQDTRNETWDKAIKIAKGWTDAYRSCREHFDDPCCHVRVAATIAEALETRKATARKEEKK